MINWHFGKYLLFKIGNREKNYKELEVVPYDQ